MREIFRYIKFRKELHALPCLYVEDYSNKEYRAFYTLATGEGPGNEANSSSAPL